MSFMNAFGVQGPAAAAGGMMGGGRRRRGQQPRGQGYTLASMLQGQRGGMNRPAPQGGPGLGAGMGAGFGARMGSAVGGDFAPMMERSSQMGYPMLQPQQLPQDQGSLQNYAQGPQGADYSRMAGMASRASGIWNPQAEMSPEIMAYKAQIKGGGMPYGMGGDMGGGYGSPYGY